MAINTTTNVQSYTGNGATTVFPVPFKFFANGDLGLTETPSGGGAAVPLVEGVDYTVSGAGNDAGGTITRAVPTASGATLTITRTVDVTQPTSLSANGNTTFSPKVHENAFDRATMAAQQHETRIAGVEGRATAIETKNTQQDTTISSNDVSVRALIAANEAAMRAEFDTAPGSTIDTRTVVSTGSSAARSLAARFGEVQNLKDFGAVADGVTSDAPALASAIAALGANNGRVHVPPGTYLVGVNTTVPANASLRFEAGAKVKIANGVTLTVNSPFAAEAIQVFDESAGGQVNFAVGTVDEHRPEWWGAVRGATHTAVRAGNIDSTAALQAALREAVRTGATVQLGSGGYGLSAELVVSNRAGIRGNGIRETFLTHVNGYTGFLIQFKDLIRDPGEDDPGITYGITSVDFTKTKKSARAADFSIIGDRSQAAKGIRTYGRTDGLKLVNIGLHYLKGVALELGVSGDAGNGLARESQFVGLEVRESGDATTDQAAIEIGEGSAATDGSNHLRFSHPEVQYNYGIAIRIRASATGTQQTIRKVHFFGAMVHGRWTAADAPAADLIVIQGRVLDCTFPQLDINGSHLVGGTKYAAIRLKTDAGGFYPQAIRADYQLGPSAGHGLVHEAGDYNEFRAFLHAGDVAGYEADIQGIANTLWYSRPSDGGVYSVNIAAGVGFKLRGHPVSRHKTTFATANYTVVDDDEIIFANADANDVTITLPDADTFRGRTLRICRTGASLAHNLTVAAPGGQTIDAAATKAITILGYTVAFESNGTTSYRSTGDHVGQNPYLETLAIGGWKRLQPADGAVQPNVYGYNQVETNNTGPTTITDFLWANGAAAPNGTFFFLYTLDANTTIQNGALIETLTRTDRKLPIRSRCLFIRTASQWREVACGVIGAGLTGVDPGDADLTWTYGGTATTDFEIVRFNTALTANRTVTLANAGRGAKVRIIRTGAAGGAFNLNVQRADTTLLKALGAASSWADFAHDGTNWQLVGAGSL